MAFEQADHYFGNMTDPRMDVHIRKDSDIDLEEFVGVHSDPRTLQEGKFLIIWIDDVDEFIFIPHEDIAQVVVYDGDTRKSS